MKQIKIKHEIYYTIELTDQEVELIHRLLAQVKDALPAAVPGVFKAAEDLRKEFISMCAAASEAS
ncbi:MAG: hypothetical protein B7Z37_28630 [Verrucomicrobia bacterium 12-59-8]|nr:MAG: hypothetical protein B7Z37_28630 [Verrucomicrobia bacterium 12-59-8]